MTQSPFGDEGGSACAERLVRESGSSYSLICTSKHFARPPLASTPCLFVWGYLCVFSVFIRCGVLLCLGYEFRAPPPVQRATLCVMLKPGGKKYENKKRTSIEANCREVCSRKPPDSLPSAVQLNTQMNTSCVISLYGIICKDAVRSPPMVRRASAHMHT